MDDLFFVLSKLAWGLLSPSNLIVLFISYATLLLLLNKISAAKRVLIPTVIVSLILLAYPVSDYLIYPLESRFSKPTTLPSDVDGIIILGGGEELKQSLSWHIAELGNGGDRYIGAAVLAKHYPNVPVIFTGGSSFLFMRPAEKEAHIASQLFTAVGINTQRLILESKARNTYENFLLIKPLLPKENGHYLLVTSAFHMPRSVGIARKQNINVIPYPVDYRSIQPAMHHLDFKLFDHLEVLEPAWREWIGLAVYYTTGKTSDWLPEATEMRDRR